MRIWLQVRINLHASLSTLVIFLIIIDASINFIG